MLHERVSQAGFDVIDDGLRVIWNPDHDGVQQCIEDGKQLAKHVSQEESGE